MAHGLSRRHHTHQFNQAVTNECSKSHNKCRFVCDAEISISHTHTNQAIRRECNSNSRLLSLHIHDRMNANRIYHCNLNDTRAIRSNMSSTKKNHSQFNLLLCDKIAFAFSLFVPNSKNSISFGCFVVPCSCVCINLYLWAANKKNLFHLMLAIFINFDIDAWQFNRIRILIPFFFCSTAILFIPIFFLYLQRPWTVIIWTISSAHNQAKVQATFIVYHNLFIHFTNYQLHKMHKPKVYIFLNWEN